MLIKLSKYLVMSQDQIAGQSHNIKIGNSSFERLEEFRYLGTTLTNQNSIQEEMKSRLKSGSGMLAVIRCRMFCVHVCYTNIKVALLLLLLFLLSHYYCYCYSLVALLLLLLLLFIGANFR
jgi:hypothetical protein